MWQRVGLYNRLPLSSPLHLFSLIICPFIFCLLLVYPGHSEDTLGVSHQALGFIGLKGQSLVSSRWCCIRCRRLVISVMSWQQRCLVLLTSQRGPRTNLVATNLDQQKQTFTSIPARRPVPTPAPHEPCEFCSQTTLAPTCQMSPRALRETFSRHESTGDKLAYSLAFGFYGSANTVVTQQAQKHLFSLAWKSKGRGTFSRVTL